MAVIIGSTALKHLGIPFREPKDFDVFTPESCSYTKTGWDVQVIPYDVLELIPTVGQYATPDAIYTIKLSHLPWDISWDKHKRDALYLKKMGCKVLPELYRALSDHWKVKNGGKEFLSLKQNKSDFFDDHVTYCYDHDYLHELISWPNTPIYAKVLKAGEDVLVDRDKFLQLSFEEQVKMFREEIGVIACERWLINPSNRGKFSLTQAWGLSLKKTITSLTKGWASEFLVLNLEHFEKPNKEDFNHIFNTLKIGDSYMAKALEKEEYDIIQQEIWGLPEEGEEDFHEFLLGWGGKDCPGLEFIRQEGGGEGGSEHCETVFKWKGVYYKVTFSYYSYEGYNFDYCRWYIVEPRQETITVYD